MKDALLLNTQDPKLVDRGDNIAMKLAPNLVGQMTVEQLEYFEANPPELTNAARRALCIRENAQGAPRIEVTEPKLAIPNLRQTGPTLGEWLKAREELHRFFTGENVVLQNIFVFTDEELASTALMPAFRPAHATNRMAVEWKQKMRITVAEETDVMRYKNSIGSPEHELYLIIRSVTPDADTLGDDAKSPDGLIVVPNKLWLGLFGWCDADTLYSAITGKHLDPKTVTWFPRDRLPDVDKVAYGCWRAGQVKLFWNYRGRCFPRCGARSAKKVPLKPQT